MSDTFSLAGTTFTSRLIIGTGKYRSYDEMKAAHAASGAEMGGGTAMGREDTIQMIRIAIAGRM